MQCNCEPEENSAKQTTLHSGSRNEAPRVAIFSRPAAQPRSAGAEISRSIINDKEMLAMVQYHDDHDEPFALLERKMRGRGFRDSGIRSHSIRARGKSRRAVINQPVIPQCFHHREQFVRPVGLHQKSVGMLGVGAGNVSFFI